MGEYLLLIQKWILIIALAQITLQDNKKISLLKKYNNLRKAVLNLSNQYKNLLRLFANLKQYLQMKQILFQKVTYIICLLKRINYKTSCNQQIAMNSQYQIHKLQQIQQKYQLNNSILFHHIHFIKQNLIKQYKNAKKTQTIPVKFDIKNINQIQINQLTSQINYIYQMQINYNVYYLLQYQFIKNTNITLLLLLKKKKKKNFILIINYLIVVL
ncbi:hypothetical protein TTHERM_000151189 (macronuclear) [Tetrahymena thermophila SB210]|uniref:Transmembrane protein n=1 Tax=Tetrahymena thermophila (strain SB210) TaxID=312017 RepID=W7X9G3_TETTS|nr:hypothetical protein TTHERM_000151189 [Tetrahymena thermophila SB210]EWS73038.1 hypothetical protein TTHERM_000151189 [Tetrahymena thermophila SB210]|eukprot:XP_012654435.1 hypothetical protein TTHERM_000151189 [Tetrahymena thermophila SB210]